VVVAPVDLADPVGLAAADAALAAPVVPDSRAMRLRLRPMDQVPN